MEATPPPEPRLEGAPPPSQPDKAGGGLRALAVLGALILGFAAAVIIAVMIDLGGGPLCEDVGGADHPLEDCWDVSSAGQVISLVLGWPGAVAGALAALAALIFAVTGRNGRRVWLLTGLAVVLCGLSIAVAQFM